MKIVNFGSLNLDYVYAVPHFCRGGETLAAQELTASIGGKGLNQSIAVARSGAVIWHAGMLGEGGAPLRACLNESGVDTTLLEPCPAQQGHAIIQVDPNGQNCIIVFGGSNRQVVTQYIDRALDHFAPGDYLLVQNEISNLPYLVHAAHEKGMRVVLNASPIDETLSQINVAELEWLVVNELECAAIAGCGDVNEAYEALKVRYPGVGILLTLGAEGSVSFQAGEEVRQQAYRAEVVDTTGAGDTFAGYFVSCLTRGYGRQKAMRIASMASSIVVSRPGAAQSIPMIAEVEAALAQW